MNTAKIISVIIYSTIVFAFVTMTTLISTLYLGLPNGDKPISFVLNSFYNLSIKEYYIGTLAFSYLGTLICSLIIMLASLLTKNIITGFIVPVVLYLLPQIIRFTGSFGYIWDYINFNQIFTGENILAEYADFNIFGAVVTYPYLISFLAISSIIIISLVYNNFARKQKID